jgi:hypothetical protein
MRSARLQTLGPRPQLLLDGLHQWLCRSPAYLAVVGLLGLMLGDMMESHGTAKEASPSDKLRFVNTDDHRSFIVENVIQRLDCRVETF